MIIDSIKDFLESSVPSRAVEISGLGVEIISSSGYESVCLNLPLIELICDT